MAETYTRRPPPAAYDPAYFATELATIQRVLAGVSAPTSFTEANLTLSDVVTDDVSIARHGFTPKLSGNAGEFLNGLGGFAVPSASGTITQAGRLMADVSTSGGSMVTSTLTLAVLIGESWHLRWVLALGTSVGASSGISLQVTAPTNTFHFGMEAGVRTSAVFSATSIATPILFATAIANGDFSASASGAIIDASFYNFTANGTIDLQFKNAGGGETAILRQASTFTAVKTG